MDSDSELLTLKKEIEVELAKEGISEVQKAFFAMQITIITLQLQILGIDRRVTFIEDAIRQATRKTLITPKRGAFDN